MPADGDCFFHAVVYGLRQYGMEISPQHIRNAVAQVIEKDAQLYEQLLDEWIDFSVIPRNHSMSPVKAAILIRSKEWATSTIIHITSRLFNIKINVYEEINGTFITQSFPYPWDTSPKQKDLRLPTINVLHRREHFDALQPLDSTTITQTNYIYAALGICAMLALSFW